MTSSDVRDDLSTAYVKRDQKIIYFFDSETAALH